ncbi:MAG: HAMP domain-containing protein [Candidatus Omnitrophica bacterium]|nr:HAMP domain-containing protein [Candidatus Omnitrophota bacterium]MBU1852734.1 HAMP domain-containing protein [Candidatus Omnitrophota bacterium]
MLRFKDFRNLRITVKFILWFLFIALVPLSIATYISYDSSRKVLEEEVANSLVAVADNKANQVMVYLREKEGNVTRLSHTSDIIEAIERYSEAFYNNGVNTPEYSSIDEGFRPFLTYYQKSFVYDELFLISFSGDVVFSINERPDARSLYEIALYENSELAKVFIRTKKSLKTEISDFEYYPETKKAALFISAPVFKGADLIGAVALQMNNQELCELVKDYTGLGETGETVIASRMGDEVVFITPVRFDPHAAFERKISINSEEGIYIQNAVQGKRGLGTFVDYRGQGVLTVWRYLPLFRWGMVVKMDTDEIFASAHRLRNTLLIISLTLSMVVVVMAILIARSVSSPIRELTKVSGTIAYGDLTARATIDTKDEIGELARSFNQMTDSLVEAKANVERKKAELEEQKKLLEIVNRELDSFVYTASHDLRAPLRGIEAFSGFLEKDYADKIDDEGKKYLSRIRSGISRMSRLIDDLLTLSRISRVKNPFEDVNMNDLVSSIIERIEFDIKEHKVELKIAKDMPVVHCDRIKMGEVFLNLINNAVKFSSKNKDINPKVGVGCMDKGDSYEFYVKDNGIGIDKKYHKDIFGMFKRLHKQEEYEGTGAGLSIVKRVIDDHQGQIWVESEPGKGSTFHFTIPKQQVQKKKLGEILIEDGTISKEELNKALRKQEKEEDIS